MAEGSMCTVHQCDTAFPECIASGSTGGRAQVIATLESLPPCGASQDGAAGTSSLALPVWALVLLSTLGAALAVIVLFVFFIRHRERSGEPIWQTFDNIIAPDPTASTAMRDYTSADGIAAHSVAQRSPAMEPQSQPAMPQAMSQTSPPKVLPKSSTGAQVRGIELHQNLPAQSPASSSTKTDADATTNSERSSLDGALQAIQGIFSPAADEASGSAGRDEKYNV